MSEEKNLTVTNTKRGSPKSHIGNAQPTAKAGYVKLCWYCGEEAPCGTCKTKKGRKEIFDANVKILKDLRKAGYCKGTVYLLSPD